MKDTNASIKLKNDEPKDKHASRRPTSQGQLPSNQPKNKNRDISKLEEKVKVLQEDTATLRSTENLLKSRTLSESPPPKEIFERGGEKS